MIIPVKKLKNQIFVSFIYFVQFWPIKILKTWRADLFPYSTLQKFGTRGIRKRSKGKINTNKIIYLNQIIIDGKPPSRFVRFCSITYNTRPRLYKFGK